MIRLNPLSSITVQPNGSAVRSPVDLLDVTLVETLTVKWTRARSNLPKLVQTYLAQHVPARKEDLNIIAIVGATAACHLRLPQLVFHASNLQVHAAHAHFARCLRSTFKLLPHNLSFHLQFCHLLFHFRVRVLNNLQLRQSLRLTESGRLKLILLRGDDFILEPSLTLEVLHQLLLLVQLGLNGSEQLGPSFFFCISLLLYLDVLLKLIRLTLATEFEAANLPFHLLLLLFQLSIQSLVLSAVRLQLVYAFLHTVDLGI